jgi:hypothetical protein
VCCLCRSLLSIAWRRLCPELGSRFGRIPCIIHLSVTFGYPPFEGHFLAGHITASFFHLACLVRLAALGKPWNVSFRCHNLAWRRLRPELGPFYFGPLQEGMTVASFLRTFMSLNCLSLVRRDRFMTALQSVR